MNRIHEMICIGCPMGCRLTVIESENKGWLVEGNSCKRGVSYAVNEIENPVRTVTTTVRMEGSAIGWLPVKTAGPVPKDKVLEVVRQLQLLVIEGPVAVGDRVAYDIAGTGVDVVASRSVKQA